MTSDLPGRIRCPTCGNLTPAGRYCTRCGTALPQDDATEVLPAWGREPERGREPYAVPAEAGALFIPEPSDELARREPPTESAAEPARVDYFDDASAATAQTAWATEDRDGGGAELTAREQVERIQAEREAAERAAAERAAAERAAAEHAAAERRAAQQVAEQEAAAAAMEQEADRSAVATDGLADAAAGDHAAAQPGQAAVAEPSAPSGAPPPADIGAVQTPPADSSGANEVEQAEPHGGSAGLAMAGPAPTAVASSAVGAGEDSSPADEAVNAKSTSVETRAGSLESPASSDAGPGEEIAADAKVAEAEEPAPPAATPSGPATAAAAAGLAAWPTRDLPPENASAGTFRRGEEARDDAAGGAASEAMGTYEEPVPGAISEGPYPQMPARTPLPDDRYTSAAGGYVPGDDRSAAADYGPPSGGSAPPEYGYGYGDGGEDADGPRRRGVGFLPVLGFLVLAIAALLGGAVLFSVLNASPGVAEASPTPTPAVSGGESGAASPSGSAAQSAAASASASSGPASIVPQPDNFSAKVQPCATSEMGFSGCGADGSTLSSGKVWVWVGFKNGQASDVIGVTLLAEGSSTPVGDGSLELDRLSGCNPGKTCTGYLQMSFGGLAPGNYTINVTRNDEQVATTGFTVSG